MIDVVKQFMENELDITSAPVEGAPSPQKILQLVKESSEDVRLSINEDIPFINSAMMSVHLVYDFPIEKDKDLYNLIRKSSERMKKRQKKHLIRLDATDIDLHFNSKDINFAVSFLARADRDLISFFTRENMHLILEFRSDKGDHYSSLLKDIELVGSKFKVSFNELNYEENYSFRAAKYIPWKKI